MTNIFTYGTLMYQDVMYGLCSQKYAFKHATLQGYQRKHINDRPYPGLIKSSKQSVKGIVYLGVNKTDCQYLHSYEWQYNPIEVDVVTEDNKKIKALAYLYKLPQNTTKQIWDPKTYEQKYRK